MPASLKQAATATRLAEQCAAVLISPGRFMVQAQTIPDRPAPDEVLVRIRGCGICASSIPLWEGRDWFDYPRPPGEPGHEGWGEIAETGDASTHLQRGQRVACLGGTAFSEYMTIPAQHVVPLPEMLGGMPFPGEAIGCAMNIFRRAQVEAGQTIAIIGAGFLGLLLVQLAVSSGARTLVFSRRESVRQMARHFGAEATFETDDWWGSATEAVALTEGKGCDRVIEVTGLQFALDLATELIAEYGRLVIGGYHQDGQRQINMQKWNWKAIDVINGHERNPHRYIQGIEAGIRATVEHRISPQALLTHRFTLDTLDDAFRMMRERPDGFIKGWVAL